MLHRVKLDNPKRLIWKAEILAKLFVRRRGFWLRTLLCWVIGVMALSSDEGNSFDQRFQLRGDQKTSSQIVLVTIKQSDFASVYGKRTNSISNLSELTDITDSFFWNKEIWHRLLKILLEQNPKSVGVTLYFGINVGEVGITNAEAKIFKDPRVIWSTSTNNFERLYEPLFANDTHSNIASNDLRRDEDGVIRHIFSQSDVLPHLVEKVTNKKFPQLSNGLNINYRGSTRVFAQYSLAEVLNDETPPNAFKDKIILIGAETSSGPQYLTPVGPLSRSEVLAHVTDTMVGNKWIRLWSFPFYALLFLALTFFAVFLITQYPQSVALVFVLWLALSISAMSAWIFDTFYLWIPAYSPFILLLTTWIIFIGYQANRIERLNFRLQQEQKYLSELEQLKNNFVSLISHDLKTPIAKIQAIVDRLMNQHTNPELQEDLKSLRRSGDELNKYIQSILKVLRVESRDFKVHKEVADINEVLEEAISQLSPLAAEKDIRLQTELEPMFSVEFDTTLIKEVVVNLIENAIKYTPRGGQIEIMSTETEESIYVRVKDNGEGIRDEDIDTVWGKFTRGRDQDMKTKGTGLGLYLVKYFIELHGGKVSLESKVGAGTTVSFTLPLNDDTSEAPNKGAT
ncbi:MAG: CHASE2 domain-containing protein [Bdellovibrionaceae bacterium]|nr:CHASE2 domain-containing protein [Pseudobdellovibrionaceae bacterium]